jgi:hypothetical protein
MIAASAEVETLASSSRVAAPVPAPLRRAWRRGARSAFFNLSIWIIVDLLVGSLV